MSNTPELGKMLHVLVIYFNGIGVLAALARSLNQLYLRFNLRS